MALAATNRQLPDHSIMDFFNKQTYLGNQYSANKVFSIGTTETPLLLLNNAQVGSVNNVKGLFKNLVKVVENTAAQTVILNVYTNPTVTGAGTPLTPVNMRSSYGNNSVATLTFSPTVSANGALVDSISALALGVGLSTILNILDQTQTLFVTGIASAAATSITAILQWYEI